MTTPTPEPTPNGGQPTPPSGWGGPVQPPQYGQYGQYGHQDPAPSAPGMGHQPGQQSSYDQPGQYGQYGQYGAPGSTQQYMVAQPGIMPLRPLTLGELYDAAFKAIRANPAVMFGAASVIVVLVTIVQAIGTWRFYGDYLQFTGAVSPSQQDVNEMLSALGQQTIALVTSQLVTFFLTTLLNGILLHSVAQSVIGRKLTLGQLWSLLKPQLGKLVLLSLMIGLAMVVVMLVAISPLLLAAMAGSIEAMAVGVLVSIPLMLAGFFLVTVFTVLATPALVLERSGPMTALKRSWTLTRGMFWRIAGIYLLSMLLVGIVGAIVAAPFSGIASYAGNLDVTRAAAFAGQAISLVVTTPFTAALIALLYIDVRIRREGLDVELAAAAQTNEG